MVKDRFKGKVVIVTGTTHGMGQATAVRLATEGAIVVCNHRPTSSPDETLQMVKSSGGEAFPIAADMSKSDEVIKMIRETVKQAGRLDYIVSNAAIIQNTKFDQTALETYDLMMDTNLRGTWVVCTEGAKEIIKEGHGGAIVTIASISALVGAPDSGVYCATKAGVLMMSKALARDLGKYNVRVNCIIPGPIMTNMTRDFFKAGTITERFYSEKAALKRIGKPGEIASAVSFLLSDDASYITSAELLVDGGFIVNAEYDEEISVF